MSDGYLTFQIQETILLSSDKPPIGEWKELELLPDVEIIENDRDITITGCLQLFGKYKPSGDNTGKPEELTNSLAEDLKFTPFDLEESFPLLREEADLVHRIPVNISIPITRVKQMDEVYAIIHAFDYELKNPRQMTIEAELKLSGIYLDENTDATTVAPSETWEVVQVAHSQPEEHDHPITMEEIERKLAQLEEELEREERNVFPSSYSEESYWKRDESFETEDFTAHSTEDFTAHSSDVFPAADPQFSYTETEQEPEWTAGAGNEYADPAAEEWDGELVSGGAEEETIAEEAEMVVTEAANENSIQGVKAEEKEMKVAISSKQPEPQSEPLNLTSIFSNAGRRAQQYFAQAENVEESTDSSYQDLQKFQNAREAVETLTSFVREEGERFRKLKLCIIQREETLQLIAERYSIPVSLIREVNQLTSDQLQAGQVLYIPQ